MKKSLLDANLLKKYHHDIFFNYSDYPTKDNWNYNFNNAEYKNHLLIGLTKTKSNRFYFMFTPLFVNNYAIFAFVAKK